MGQINMDKTNLLSDIIQGRARLPLANRQAMAYLQSRDKDLLRVRELLRAGQRPSIKRDEAAVKVYFRADVTTSVDRLGCIIVTKQNRTNLVRRELVAVPNSISMGILYSLHVNLDHPPTDQLYQVVDTRFFMQDLLNKCKEINSSCTLCTSVEPIPDEIHQFSHNTVPDHPGESFTIDVMRENKKLVLVAVDNFSAYVATTFIASEKEEDLRDGVLSTVTPFMANSLTKIRVDRAPGFTKMAGQKEVLQRLGIDMELGHAKNKNSLAMVDQKIKELRMALKRVSPSPNVLNQACLSRATTIINEKIRHHKLSAKEIHFGREGATNKPIPLDDDKISKSIQASREEKNKNVHSTKRKATSAGASEGQLVFIKAEGDKRSRRDLYLVLASRSQDNTLTICKVRDALSNQHASMAPQDGRYRYMVKQTDVILAPNQPSSVTYPMQQLQAYEEEEDYDGEELQHQDGTEQENEETDDWEDLWYPVYSQEQPDRKPEESEHNAEEEQIDDHTSEAESEEETEEEAPQQTPPAAEVEHQEELVDDDNTDETEGEQDDDNTGEEEAEADDLAEQIPALAAEEQDLESEENVQEQEAEANEVQEEGNQRAAAENIDQSRRPVRGDIIAFVKGSFWTKARITSKVTGYPYYFNIEYEDGTLDGLYLRPPSEETKESWTFIRPNHWTPLVSNPDKTQNISQLDGTDTPSSLSPASSTSSTATPTANGKSTPSLATVEEINRRPMIMDPFPLEDGDLEQAPVTDTSMDWDNYNSDPTFTSMELSTNFVPLDDSNLNISSDTDSDIVTLSQDDALEENDDHAQAEPADDPPLHRRADRVLSVINCSAGTCKKRYKPPPS